MSQMPTDPRVRDRATKHDYARNDNPESGLRWSSRSSGNGCGSGRQSPVVALDAGRWVLAASQRDEDPNRDPQSNEEQRHERVDNMIRRGLVVRGDRVADSALELELFDGHRSIVSPEPGEFNPAAAAKCCSVTPNVRLIKLPHKSPICAIGALAMLLLLAGILSGCPGRGGSVPGPCAVSTSENGGERRCKEQR